MSTQELAQRVWDIGKPLKGPVVEAYYGWRGLAVLETRNLRFVASLKHYKNSGSHPAIIARAENLKGVMTGILQQRNRGLEGAVVRRPAGALSMVETGPDPKTDGIAPTRDDHLNRNAKMGARRSIVMTVGYHVCSWGDAGLLRASRIRRG